MSVINQMLKDLEKRAKTPARSHLVLSQAKTPAIHQKKGNYSSFLIAFIFLLLACALVSVPYFINKPVYANKSDVISSTIPTEKISLSKNIHEIEFNPNISNALLTGITLQTQADMTFLRFLLNNQVLYRVEENLDKHQLIIVLEHARLLTSLPPINYENSAIQHISMSNDRNDELKVVINLQENSSLQQLKFSETSKLPELQIDIHGQNNLMTTNAATEKQNPLLIKKYVLDVNADEEYRHALSFASSGQIDKAIELIKSLLNRFPNNHPARQTLITLLLQKGDRAAAEKIVDAGLMEEPDYLNFVELKARILFDEDKVGKALSLLEHVSPPIAEHPSYYSFLAAMYQRQGQPQIAVKLYEQLLSLQPNKGIFWVGLAIALESIGKHNQAQEAFARADDAQGLSPEIKAYVENALHET